MILVYRLTLRTQTEKCLSEQREKVWFLLGSCEKSLSDQEFCLFPIPFQIEKAIELPRSASDEVTVVAVSDLENESWLNITQSQPLLPTRRDMKMKSTQFLRTCRPVMAKSVSPFFQVSCTFLEDRTAGP